MTSRRIVVLYGGSSAEREVSLQSGEAVTNALRSLGHRVEPIDPVRTPVRSIQWDRFDSAFIALHGTYGEDGVVQKELDDLGVRYTGSSSAASALAFDKERAKEAFRLAGVRTPASRTISRDDNSAELRKAADEIGFPLVVKPCCQGSSVGVTIVLEPPALETAIARCFEHDRRGLIESAVLREEWTVGVFNRRCLTPIRVEPARGFYDYEAKYHDERTSYHLAGTETAEDFVNDLQQISQRACEALGTSGVARVDLMVDDDRRPWVLEVNTVPGFTTHSLIPKAATAAGLTLAELCEAALPDLDEWQGNQTGS